MITKKIIKSVVIEEFENAQGEFYCVLANTEKFIDSADSSNNKTITELEFVEIEDIEDEEKMPLVGEEVNFDGAQIERLPIKPSCNKRIANIIDMFELLASASQKDIGRANRLYFYYKDGAFIDKKSQSNQMFTTERFSNMLDVIQDISNEQNGARLDSETFTNGKLPLMKEVENQKQEIEKILEKPIDNWGDDLNHALDVYSVKCSYVLSYTAKIKKQQENMEEEQSLGL